MDHLLCVSSYGFPMDAFDLKGIVHDYLKKSGRTVAAFKSNFPGKDWATSFVKRHPDINTRIARNIKKARAAVSDKEIQNFFTNIARELEGVPDTNIWNYDETMIVKRGCKYPERIIDTNKTVLRLSIQVSQIGIQTPTGSFGV